MRLGGVPEVFFTTEEGMTELSTVQMKLTNSANCTGPSWTMRTSTGRKENAQNKKRTLGIPVDFSEEEEEEESLQSIMVLSAAGVGRGRDRGRRRRRTG